MAEPLGELQVLAPALMVAAQLSLADDEFEGTIGYLKEFAAVTRDVAETYRESLLSPIARIAVAAGEVDLVSELVDLSGGRTPREDLNVRSAAAAVAEARGELETAGHGYAATVDGWRAYGNPFELAMALLGLARCSDAIGRTETGLAAEAQGILRSLGVPA